MHASKQLQKYKLQHWSLLCENFITASSTQHVMEYIFEMPIYYKPLILSLFENESPTNILLKFEMCPEQVFL